MSTSHVPHKKSIAYPHIQVVNGICSCTKFDVDIRMLDMDGSNRQQCAWAVHCTRHLCCGHHHLSLCFLVPRKKPNFMFFVRPTARSSTALTKVKSNLCSLCALTLSWDLVGGADCDQGFAKTKRLEADEVERLVAK